MLFSCLETSASSLLARTKLKSRPFMIWLNSFQPRFSASLDTASVCCRHVGIADRVYSFLSGQLFALSPMKPFLISLICSELLFPHWHPSLPLFETHSYRF